MEIHEWLKCYYTRQVGNPNCDSWARNLSDVLY
jgi:hypothetical protein